MNRTLQLLCLGSLVLAASVAPARATDHLMVIQEVLPGTLTDPNAQYVMLRMTSSGQNLVGADFIEVQDANGAVLGRFGSFATQVAGPGTVGCAYPNCPAIIIGTSAAQTLLGFTFDVIVDSQAGRVALPLAGGRVCFRNGTLATNIPDCVAYGSFTGTNTIAAPTANACDANFGAPASALSPDFALTRTVFNCAAKENSTDFGNRLPHPVANNGGNANADTDADGLINVLDCGDNDATSLYAVLGVVNLDVAGGAITSLSWSAEPAPAGTSLRYDVSRLDPESLRLGPTCDAAEQLAGTFIGNGLTGTSMQDADIPAPGGIFCYVARSRNGCGGAPFC